MKAQDEAALSEHAKKNPDVCVWAVCESSKGLQFAVVVLDDRGFVDIERELVALGEPGEGSGELVGIDGDVADGSGPGLHGFLDHFERAFLFEADDVADLAEAGSDIALLAIHEDVAVVHELTGAGAAAGESHAIDEVVEPGLKDPEEGETGDGRVFLSDEEEATELALVDAVEVAELLLFEKLAAVFGGFPLAVVAVLARAIGTLLQLLAGLEDREIEVAGLFPSAFGVPRHLCVLLSLRLQS